jgi:hypothetical protein
VRPYAKKREGKRDLSSCLRLCVVYTHPSRTMSAHIACSINAMHDDRMSFATLDVKDLTVFYSLRLHLSLSLSLSLTYASNSTQEASSFVSSSFPILSYCLHGSTNAVYTHV